MAEISINEMSDTTVPDADIISMDKPNKRKYLRLLIIPILIVILIVAFVVFWNVQYNKYTKPLISNPVLEFDENKYASDKNGIYTDREKDCIYAILPSDFPGIILSVTIGETLVRQDNDGTLSSDYMLHIAISRDLLGNLKYSVNVNEILPPEKEGNERHIFGMINGEKYEYKPVAYAYAVFDESGNYLEGYADEGYSATEMCAKYKDEINQMIDNMYDTFGKENLT